MISNTFGDAYELGASVAAGDTDGDGADDVILGGPNDYDDGVYLFLGPVTADRTSADIVFDNGSGLQQSLGWNVELVPDADGDGAPDLVMGAPEAENLSGTEDCGIVYVVPAAPGGDVNLRDSTYLFVTNAKGRLGDAITSGLDTNGDGISDIAMSAPDTGAGAIYVVEGGAEPGVSTASAVAVTTITPDPVGGQFDGVDLVAADYDADGHDDLDRRCPGSVERRGVPLPRSDERERLGRRRVRDVGDCVARRRPRDRGGRRRSRRRR